MINNIYFDSAKYLENRKNGITCQSDAELVIARAAMATAFEARTQTLIALYGMLEPGLDRQNILIEIMERIYA